MFIKACAVVASVMIGSAFPIRASECLGDDIASSQTLQHNGSESRVTLAAVQQPLPSAADQSKQQQGVPGIDATSRPSRPTSSSQSSDHKGDTTAGEENKPPPASPQMPTNPTVDTSAPPAGSPHKIGPVTDDQKMIKPVAGDSKAQKKEDKTESSKQANPPETGNATEQEKGPISEAALKLASDLKMIDSINHLLALKRDRVYVPGQSVHTLEVVSVRQDLDEVLFSTLLQARRVLSQVDRQISGYDAVARVLEDKRDQAIRYNNIINFTTGGTLAMTQGGISIGTPMKYQNAGNELGAISGGLTALISAYALKIQRGGKRSAERDPNMLAPIFGLLPANQAQYPPVVWNYLNEKELGQKKTRREQLIERWVKLGYIEPLDDKRCALHMAQLAGTVPLHKEVTIALLRDRIPMLDDVRSTVNSINEYLDEILTFVRQP